MDLQQQLEKTQMDLLMEKSNGQQMDQDRVNQLEALEVKLLQQITEEQNQQNLEERVGQAKETGYIFDKLETSGGVKMIDLSYSPENHELQAIAVQRLFLSQEQAFNNQLQAEKLSVDYMNTVNKTLIDDINKVREDKENLERINFTLEQEKQDAYLKIANATDIIAEKDAEIKRLQELQNNVQAVPVIPLSKEEKETQLMAEVMGKQIKVIDVKPELDTFDNKIFLAVNVLTGAEIKDNYIYLCKLNEVSPKRYKEISLEEAAQLKADYDAKKAEIEAQNTVIPTLESVIEPVTEVEAPAEEKPFPESEVHSTEPAMVEGSPSSDREVPAAESEVVTLESLKAELEALKTAHDTTVVRVDNIEKHANIGLAVA